MSRLRKVAEIPAGTWTKWVVVGFWVVVLVVTFPLAGKLTGAEKNDAKSWLPANAESTKVLDVQAHFQSPNVYPAVVVYQRAAGLTAADRAKAAADARDFARLPGVGPGQVTGPLPAADGRAIETVLQVNVGKQGWAGTAKAADARAFAHLPGVGPGQVAGPLPSADGRAIETILQVNVGKQGWAGTAKAADSIRAITRAHANGLASYVTGPPALPELSSERAVSLAAR